MSSRAGRRRDHKQRLRVFNAFTPDGHLTSGLRVVERSRGYCWEGSLADPRSDAWRCFLGDNIFDPCFASGYGASLVVCPDAPWSNRVTVLRLTKALPRHFANRNTDPTRLGPWGIITAAGKHCVLLTGATGVIAGMRINYGCVGGGALVGGARRSAPTWTIFYEATIRSRQLVLVKIASAWW